MELDARGYERSLATLPGYHAGRTPPNKGMRYPRRPPAVTDILALLAACPDTIYGHRLRALIVFLWRTGLRISEALALYKEDLVFPTPGRLGSVYVRQPKNGEPRTVGSNAWGSIATAPRGTRCVGS